MKLNYLLYGGLALTLFACADDSLNNGNSNNPADSGYSVNYATMLAGQNGQTRAINVDTWAYDASAHDHSDIEEALNFTVPGNAVDITVSNFDKSGNVFYVPSSFDGTLDLNWFEFNDGSALYIQGKVNGISNTNINGTVKIYVDYDAELGYLPTSGNMIVYNRGTFTMRDNENVSELYNSGDVIFERNHNEWWPNDGGIANIPDKMSIYSIGGTIQIPDGADFKAYTDIHNLVTVNGDINFQNSKAQYICGLEVTGKITLPDNGLAFSYVKADEIEFNGHAMKLLPQGHVVANKISMPNSGCAVTASEGSYALIETNDIIFKNQNNFQDSFSDNIYFKVDGKIEIQEILVRDNGQQDNVYSTYNSVDEYIVSQNGVAVADRFQADLGGAPDCGPNYGTTPPEEEDGPTLELVTTVISPSHNHNDDKNDGNRFLSATCLDWDGSTIYVSYHMRGQENHYAGDTYDKDGIEGCIETWRLNTNDEGQTVIKLGQYMWTDEFDFNHLIIDGADIVTVGSMEKKGAIIGKIPNTFKDFNLSDDEGKTYSKEMKYKVLTTDEEIWDDFTNPSGIVTNQLVDYKNAGDGNCLIRVGDDYFVATYEGYGRVNAETMERVKDETGTVQFVSTPGSVKHIINNNGEIAMLYLNEKPESSPTSQSSVSLATVSSSSFPFNAEVKSLTGYVQPVDGKNVLASYNDSYYACLGKGGLNVNNSIFNFGENEAEPVNAVAIDDEYVYLATGSHVRVLDHSMNEIAKYHVPYASANYIKVVDYNGEKYILAAFGQSGIKVLRLKK